MSNKSIIAISCSHNASVAVLRNNVITSAALEERFSRKKNYVGYPKQAIDYCLHKDGITPSDIEAVAITTINHRGLFIKAKTSTQFTLKDYDDYYGERYYGRRFTGDRCDDYLKWLNSADQFNSDRQYFDFSYLTEDVLLDGDKDAALFRDEQRRIVSRHLGVAEDLIHFVDHHTCHAYYAYFGSPFRDRPCVALTMDGWGDERNQTVWKVSENRFELLADSQENDLARIYKMATLILGMRPDEHEFKVMGLAAYAKPAYVAKSLSVLQDLLKVDGLKVLHNRRPTDLYAYLSKSWRLHRFDNIAGAVQAYTEAIATQLVRNIINETGIRRLVISGGVAMNVKMNKAIAELPEVEEIFVCGSGGDESLSIGGCYYMNRAHRSEPLKTMYLGRDISVDVARLDLDRLRKKFVVTIDVDFNQVAQLLIQGDIVAVIRGRAEFGARALGNRSILADPSRRESVQKINEAIKNRDFWMPFALSIMHEHHCDYLHNPKNISSPFMATCLDARAERYDKIQAGTHPYDKTVRPQFVSIEDAPQYYKLISAFYEKTGVPALLNTSFNLHGEPIVDTIDDALRTFEASGLDHLLIDDTIMVSKTTPGCLSSK